MFKNYLKIALRNLTKFKGYAAINIVGLAVGVAVCLLITLYVQSEMRYDQHHADLEQLYRVNSSWVIDGKASKSPGSASPVAQQLVEDFAEVETATRVYKVPNVEQIVVQYEDQLIIEKRAAFADENFFELLTYDLTQGDPTTVLDAPSSIVLSKEMAAQLFKNTDPIGKTVTLNCIFGESPYQVTGIFDASTYPSHLQAGFYAASRGGVIGKEFYEIPEWAGMNIYYTYVKMHPTANAADLNSKLPAWLDKYAGARLAEVGIEKGHFLQAVSDIYLDPEVPSRWFGKKGSRNSIYVLSIIAAFILLIACINFMNLATAKATIRGREVGVRKVLGASRESLLLQFFSEAFVYAVIAVSIAAGLIWWSLPYFNQLIVSKLTFNPIQLLPLALVFIVIITLAAGSYPALYLSSFEPSKIFRNNFSNHLSGQKIRKGLVVLQFLVGIALIQGVLIINEQMDFIQNKSLGFDPTAKIVIPLQSTTAQNQYENLRQTLLKNPNVTAAGGTSNYPGEDNVNTFFYLKEGQSVKEGFMCLNSSITPEYVEMMDFDLLAGRLFEQERMAYDTSRAAVITKTAMEGIGFTLAEAVGQPIKIFWQDSLLTFEVIGVIDDFHSQSLHEPLQGEVFDWSFVWKPQYVVTEIATDDLPTTLARIEKDWAIVNPNDPFQYQFLDERLQQNYLTEQRTGKLVMSGSLFAIFISCLGLLGLAAFATERRRKEIGIRKVLGASLTEIVHLLNKDFLKPVFIAILLASPITYYLATQWLNNFHYRTAMPWWVFLLAGVLAIIVAFSTVSVQSIKVALQNPTDSLKDE